MKRVALALLVALAACRSIDRAAPTTPAAGDAAPGRARPALHLLDDRHAAAFRQTFDDARDRARYVAAFSPT